MRLRSFLLPGLALLAAAPFWLRADPAPEPIPPPSGARPPHASRDALLRLEIQGTASCASMSCHNADPGPGGGRGREMTIALERGAGHGVMDKHAQAYSVLYDERSQRIVRNLYPYDEAKAKDPHPEHEALCLRCHVHPNFDRQAARVVDGTHQFRLEDGVSCEACHGPAEKWLAAHFRPGWAGLSAADKQARGMIDTKSVGGRVQGCVDCHVGTGSLDVNHDLIAAGHPRLNFAFSQQHRDLHKHWDYAKDKNPLADPRGRTDFEARGWAVGQLAAARAALDLLADRAGHADRPWPEFAEYDCYACHHQIQGQSWRRDPALTRPRLGTLEWNRWYYAVLPDAARALGVTAYARLGDQLDALEKEMARPFPDRKAVAAQARRAADVLAGWLADADRAPAELLAVDASLRQVIRRGSDRPLRSWDDAKQISLSLEALDEARRDMGGPPAGADPLLPDLQALRTRLRFPRGFDSPADFRPQPVREQLKELRKAER